MVLQGNYIVQTIYDWLFNFIKRGCAPEIHSYCFSRVSTFMLVVIHQYNMNIVQFIDFFFFLLMYIEIVSINSPFRSTFVSISHVLEFYK